ncbi:type VII secretion protein EsaA [Priestia megaterium]|uniref:Type VII secretion system accessory factor EsaA n=1 Tax=Priestia megaterium TaxID=1404 RepID=A0A6H1NXZ6_PRIMG|nr:type VII secretion protein EsaA [Priestia megaterium]QIZ06190.1 type VII secretion protein EsaA [Priestia megaterium]
MKRVERGVLLFLVLILALSSGISYLALNQVSNSKANTDEQKMTVALVNEDQVASFNDKNYEFGAEFIKNIEKDDTHDWYVVSRGVAESGLARNVYNMMIVIPNDFTEKALSIDSKSPEQVVLNYKINASDNSNIKAKAEKTASAILGDFNRQIIDVYFASVIGNLHDAQDNIGTLVNKEQVYTNFYDQSIHRPISGYTAQFGAVESNTKISRESFTGLQDLLKGFETSLGEDVTASHTYQSSLVDFTKLKAANGLLTKGFSSQLNMLDREMNHGDVMQQLDYLTSANKAINDQFHQNGNQSATILTESAALQSYLKDTKDKMDQMNAELSDKLASDMEQLIADKLKNEIKHSSGQEQNVSLSHMFAAPDKNARDTLQKQIDLLPTLDSNDLDGLGLSDQTITQLKNVIAVTNKYNQEFGYTPNRDANGIPLSEKVKQVKSDLMTKGVTLTDTVNLQKNKKNGQEFTLSIPKEFEIERVLLSLPNSQEMDYTESFLPYQKIKLPSTDEGQFTVKVDVSLKNMDAILDVFQPITWSWELDQKDITDVDHPELPGTEEGTSAEIKKKTEQSVSSYESNQPITVEEMGKSPNDTTNEKTVENQELTQPSDNDDISIIERLQILNNHIAHQVMSPLTGDSTSVLINASSDTVSDFQKLLTLYNLYFGIGIDQFNRQDLVNDLNQTNLTDMADVDSLYYLFNKQDIVDVLASYIAEQITEEIREQTEDVKGKIDEYMLLVNNANQNAAQMSERIKETTAQAETLNTNLSETLKDLGAWREASLNLQTEQAKVLLNGDEEQQAVLSIGNEFNSLLAASQSLADQSKSNLTSADSVYQTFDAIDRQAKEIQASGTTLVQQAGNLSSNLTIKLAEDQNFADNFAGVLANSRIGERPNEDLLSFLSNPVQTKNAGVIAAGDTFTPYFVVLICFIVALFTAYVLSNHERKRLQEDTFAGEQTIVGKNIPLTIMTLSIGLVEGIVIGLLSAYLLQMSEGKFLQWIGLITLIMVTLLMVSAYLLRQLKMAGMFILLVILSLYLFLTEALGRHFDQFSAAATLRDYSPLQYIETLLMKFGSGAADTEWIIFGLVALTVVSIAGHLFVFNRSAKSEEVNHEGISEAL